MSQIILRKGKWAFDRYIERAVLRTQDGVLLLYQLPTQGASISERETNVRRILEEAIEKHTNDSIAEEPI